MFSWWLLGILDDFVLLQWLGGWFGLVCGWFGWFGFSFDGFCIGGFVGFGLGWAFDWVFLVVVWFGLGLGLGFCVGFCGGFCGLLLRGFVGLFWVDLGVFFTRRGWYNIGFCCVIVGLWWVGMVCYFRCFGWFCCCVCGCCLWCVF